MRDYDWYRTPRVWLPCCWRLVVEDEIPYFDENVSILKNELRIQDCELDDEKKLK